MKKDASFFVPLIGMGVGLVCLCGIGLTGMAANPLSQMLWQGNSQCPRPPQGFTSADLVGTWANNDIDNSDTLTIRADGKYKQVIHINYTTEPDVDYESDWHSWRLEYKDGIPYLHLEGMRLCAINPELSCDHPGGRGGFYDFCRDEAVTMDNEGILLVLGVSKYNQSPGDHRSPTRWINLWVPMGSENTFVYQLQEP
jgi:hypothetical protein